MAWVLGTKWAVAWSNGSDRQVWFGQGSLFIDRLDSARLLKDLPGETWNYQPRGVYIGSADFSAFKSWPHPDVGKFYLYEEYLTYSLWPTLLLLAVPTALLWAWELRARMRLRGSHCLFCGYDRRGLGHDVVCPECGKPSPL
jgi:hypothetical protein